MRLYVNICHIQVVDGATELCWESILTKMSYTVTVTHSFIHYISCEISFRRDDSS